MNSSVAAAAVSTTFAVNIDIAVTGHRRDMGYVTRHCWYRQRCCKVVTMVLLMTAVALVIGDGSEGSHTDESSDSLVTRVGHPKW